MFGQLKKLQLKRKQWDKKTPKQKWQSVYNFNKLLAELIGLRILSDMKNYWYSAVIGVIIIFYIITATYTAQYYSMRGEYFRSLECFCVSGIGVTVSFGIPNQLYYM